jgi:hypothetical protein
VEVDTVASVSRLREVGEASAEKRLTPSGLEVAEFLLLTTLGIALFFSPKSNARLGAGIEATFGEDNVPIATDAIADISAVVTSLFVPSQYRCTGNV